jgi:hypothetical protein
VEPHRENAEAQSTKRVQIIEYRPVVPIACQLVPLLEANERFCVDVSSVRQVWEAKAAEFALPTNREVEMRLILRSMAQLVRNRMSEEGWLEDVFMLGHHRPTNSDLYGFKRASRPPLALAATEEIIDEIIEVAPPAFAFPHRRFRALRRLNSCPACRPWLSRRLSPS